MQVLYNCNQGSGIGGTIIDLGWINDLEGGVRHFLEAGVVPEPVEMGMIVLVFSAGARCVLI